ncbi:MAG: hypothetical protein V3T86_01880 [Planctomycetota bacterium]
MSESGASTNPQLVCCGGLAAPPVIVRGVATYAKWDSDLQRSVWDLLYASMTEGPHPGHDDRGRALAETHSIPGDDLVATVQGLALLVGQSAAHDLTVEQFQQDLAKLVADGEMTIEFLVSRYASVKPELRRGIQHAALEDHGNVFTGLNWRVQKITSADRGVRLDSDIVVLTLSYSDGGEHRRLTLQFTPESIGELRTFVARLSG